MKSAKKIVGISIVLSLAIGFSVYIVYSSPWTTIITNASATTMGTSTENNPVRNIAPQPPQYDCAQPASNSQYSCDRLPVGYPLASRFPNAPPVSCSIEMTISACDLLQRSSGNGICDPNETVWTSPLDCGCTGALTGDPYLGRCGSPTGVCLVVVNRG